ncbi:MAG: alpha-amylase family glycosyl hydrolase [Acutalibacteraceae bacterium]
MKKGKIISVILVLCMLISCMSVAGIASANAVTSQNQSSSANSDVQKSSANPYGLAETVDDGMILQAWNWSYENIINELDKVGEAGFTTIQISPPNEIKEGTKGIQVVEPGSNPTNGWWMFYQPAGFQINESTDNALGTKSQLLEMVEKAHEKGIKVIADAVINHMGTCDNESSVTSSDPMDHLTPKAQIFEPEIYNNQLFHKPWVNMTYKENYWDGYSDYDIEEDLTQHCTSRLPDLDTSNQIVQDVIYDYLKELVDAGIDGFRFDAAKHIETPDDTYFASDFWDDTLVKVENYAKTTYGKDLFSYGEILNKCGDGRPYSEYFKYMEITDTAVYYSIKNNVNNGNAASVIPMNMVNGTKDQTILWAESHDTYIDGGTTNLSTTTLNKMWAVEASRDGITSLYLARPQSNSQLLGVASETGWTSTAVSEVNKFSNAYVGQGEYLESGSGVAVIGRGDKDSGGGAVLVNCNSGTTKSVSGLSAHTLADGTYVDKISGNTFTVTNGNVSGNIGNTGIAVLYGDSSKPVVSASNTGGNYTQDSITVTYKTLRATSAYYQINGGAKVPFTDSVDVTIGEGVDYNVPTTVYVYAENADGESVSKTYTYTKVDAVMLYLNPGVWDVDGAKFAAYFFASESDYTWIEMTKGSTYYECAAPSGYNSVIFVRLNPAGGLDWDSKWNQTEDLTISSYNLYSITGWGQDKSPGTWSNYNTPTSASSATSASTKPSSATQASSSKETFSTEIILVGDANGDGKITVKDATAIQKHAAKIITITGVNYTAADVNKDNTLDIKDATQIQKYIAKLGTKYNIGESVAVE